ncbi:hypothetical protein SCP_1002100 [Sparassis crispa]|uniref:Uncharacterized protein n=1 Tax=Sparassis crispa TaxID=139825 RepID=A0A401GXK8_9APHY|nr:hypothetical protein SCP_1002100 [Sparassis crispa]GBE86965.1 hypothetical protein SCP_1002100 [Sparassis crispa]
MSSHLRLPHALLDFTLTRATARLHALNGKSVAVNPWRRHGHSAVARVSDDSYYPARSENIEDRSLYARRKTSHKESAIVPQKPSLAKGSLTELEKRVLKLETMLESEEALVEIPTYTESQLLEIYEDLLALPPEDTYSTKQAALVDERAQEQEDVSLMRDVVGRLLETSEQESPTSDSQGQYSAVISRLQEIADDMGTVRIIPSESSPARQDIPTGILTNDEWSALTRTCVRAQDGQAAETVLQLMKRAGSPVPEDNVNEALALYASAGDVPNTERFLHTFIIGSLSDRQRDLHVKSRLKASPPDVMPTEALSLLHAYEERGTSAPQKSYTRVIVALLQSRSASSHAYAYAWDLFAHMRYAAHPTPDAALYTLMISACGTPNGPSQPERALDLWTEMTVDQGIPPTARAYSAVIQACARSGQKQFVHEAFRLAKEMLDADRDARGRAAFHPNGQLFRALLEGAKRVGDLVRVRWILAEMVRDSAEGDLNEVIMTHVFHTYAAYKPPFRRAATVILDKKKALTPSGEKSEKASSIYEENDTGQAVAGSPAGTLGPEYDDVLASLPVESSKSSFAHIPPQSKAEVIREARILFSRIVEDSDISHQKREEEFADPDVASLPRKFRHVQLTPRLLNAYLSVENTHAPFEDWSKLYRTLFTELHLPWSAHTYIEALERCTRSGGQERRMVIKWAEDVWSEWQEVEDRWRSGKVSEGDASQTVNARLVERANIAMIRLRATSRDTGRALDLVKTFAEHYPPDAGQGLLSGSLVLWKSPTTLSHHFSPSPI